VGWTVFRILFGAGMAVLLCWSLIGVMLTGPVVVRPQRSSLEVAPSPERMQATVEKLCEEFTPRDYTHTENLDAAAEWIAEEFRASGLAVQFQEYEVEGRRFRNVIARRPGTDPRKFGTDIIGAHYDAYGEFAGADDNASGVAVLLELVRTLPETRHRRTHLFVAFSTEEPPYFGSEQMGSHVFAESLIEEEVRVELMVALDLVGFYSDEPRSQQFPVPGLGLYYPGRGDFVAIVGDLGSGQSIKRVKAGMKSMNSIPVHSFRSSPSWAPVDLSDHSAFRKLGLPGVQVTDTAFLRYPHYHTAEDTPDQLNYERMADVVTALHGVLLERGTVRAP
jgi:Zn-dependent M28 family amino/carboxypeptidase